MDANRTYRELANLRNPFSAVARLNAGVRMRRRMFASFLLWSMFVIVLPIPILAQALTANQNAPPPLGKLVDVSGYRVHLYCIGVGSPTVVIVGAGYSFDWGLVQSEVAKFTQVCSYDHSGIGWSDDGPKDSCALRANEVHTALKNAGIEGPYVLVGHSLGGLVARVYAGKYPEEVAGMVFVDHALSFGANIGMRPGMTLVPPNGGIVAPPGKSNSPTTGGVGPIAFGMQDDPNFSRLSSQDRDLHLWFMAKPRDQKVLQANHEIVPQCFADAGAILEKHSHPLGDKPLVDVDTPDSAGAELQKTLLSISTNSKEMVADKSGHFVIIDRPDVVIDATSQVVRSARNKTPL
jgi:pimeloyl-ACP methyl ester carboxylesterase